LDYIDIVKTLKNTLKESRYIHSLSVSDTAIELAQRFNVDEQQAKLAGILHDCAREIPTSSLIEVAQKRQIKIGLIEEHQPILLHARLGAIMAQEKYGIDDNDILDAIRLHTTGSADMTDLAKIIYLADMIEPHRQYESVNRLRDLIKTSDLDTIMLNAFNDSLAFILQRGLMIHPQTILARNTLIAKNINHG